MEYSLSLIYRPQKRQLYVLAKREKIEKVSDAKLEGMSSDELTVSTHDLLTKLKRTNTLEKIEEIPESPRETEAPADPPAEKPKKRGRPKLKDGKKLISFE